MHVRSVILAALTPLTTVAGAACGADAADEAPDTIAEVAEGADGEEETARQTEELRTDNAGCMAVCHCRFGIEQRCFNHVTKNCAAYARKYCEPHCRFLRGSWEHPPFCGR